LDNLLTQSNYAITRLPDHSIPMRVIAGSFKGRRLASPSWEGLRPTSDKLRETLFNILAPRIAGARVLDGYAGTGALGIEALSRGARAVTFIEHDRRAQTLIEENLARCGIADGYAIIRASVARALETLRDETVSARGAPFDVVLFDPPYDAEIDAVLAAAGPVMGADSVLVLEHARKRRTPAAAGRLVRTREVIGGDSALAFYACQP
jgi:16S rRNA (guanine(966)-N(2))-methyltransferase RsmD